jgi:hypothetical protein
MPSSSEAAASKAQIKHGAEGPDSNKKKKGGNRFPAANNESLLTLNELCRDADGKTVAR